MLATKTLIRFPDHLFAPDHLYYFLKKNRGLIRITKHQCKSDLIKNLIKGAAFGFHSKAFKNLIAKIYAKRKCEKSKNDKNGVKA